MINRMRTEDGFSAAWLLVTLPVLVVFMGLVLDLGVYLLRSQQLDSATDAAARAATDAWDRDHWLEYGEVRIDAGRAESLARSYLKKNITGARLKSVSVSGGTRITVKAELTVPVFFMRIVGHQSKRATSSSTAVRVDAEPVS